MTHLRSLLSLLLAFTTAFSHRGHGQENAPVAALAKELADGDDAARRAASYALWKLGDDAASALPALIQGLRDDEDQVWFNATMAIAALGPAAIQAKDALIQNLRRPGGRYRDQVRYRTAYALGQLGPTILPDLTDLLEDANASVRADAAQAIGWMESQATSAIEPLIERLGDDNEEVVTRSAQALAAIGGQSLGPLMDRLPIANDGERVGVARALGELGPQAGPAATALVEQIDASDAPRFLAVALEAVARIGLPDAEAGRLFFYHLTSEDEGVYDAALNGALRLREVTPSSMVTLIALLQSTAPIHRDRAAKAIGRLGSRAVDAIPFLIAAAEDGQNAAIDALVEIGAPAVPAIVDALPADLESNDHWTWDAIRRVGSRAIPDFLTYLTDERATARLAGLRGLQAAGTLAQGAVAPVMSLRDDAEAVLRAEALLTAARLGADNAAITLQLQDALTDPSPQVRVYALRAAANVGREAFGVRNAVMENLDAEAPAVVAAAIEAIAVLGDATNPLVDRLTALISADDTAVQAASIRALGQLGPGARRALPAILDRESQVESPVLRAQLLRTMAALDPENDTVFQRLENALRVGSSATRVAAIQALSETTLDVERKLPILLAGLQSNDRPTRQRACEAIGALGEDANAVADRILPLLDDAEDRGVALDTLRALRSRDQSIYLATLSNEDAGVRLYGVEVFEFLSRRRSLEPEAQERLRDLSRNDDYFPVRRTAGRALENLRNR